MVVLLAIFVGPFCSLNAHFLLVLMAVLLTTFVSPDDSLIY